MEPIYAYTLLGLSLLAWMTTRFMLKPSRKVGLPPGPPGIPVFGNLFQLGPRPNRSLAELASKYGPVMSLKLGPMTAIIISSVEAFKEIRENDLAGSFSGRGNYDAPTSMDHDKFSIIWLQNVPRWRNIRKIAVTHLFSAVNLDANHHLRRNKVVDLLSYIERRAQEKSLIEIGDAAFNVTFNVLFNTIFSMDLANSNSNSISSNLEFKQLGTELTEAMGTPNLVDFFPFLRALDPQGIRRRVHKRFMRLMDFCNGLIEDRLAGRTMIPPDSELDMLGVLLKLSRDHTSGITRTYIPHIIGDLFFAGTDTLAITIEYAMAELIRNPDKMRKLRQELDDVIGTTRGNPIEESDIHKLPYLQATITETLRLHPPATLTFRESGRTFEVNGFIIPKGSRIWANLWAIGRDPEVWPNPLSFEPERHMSRSDRSEFIKGYNNNNNNNKLVAFGSGRRICVGIPLVVRMVPVVLGSLVHSFDWELENMALPESLDMEEVFGVTIRKAIPLCAIPIKVV